MGYLYYLTDQKMQEHQVSKEKWEAAAKEARMSLGLSDTSSYTSVWVVGGLDPNKDSVEYIAGRRQFVSKL